MPGISFVPLAALLLLTSSTNAITVDSNTIQVRGSSDFAQDLNDCKAESPWDGVKQASASEDQLVKNIAKEVKGRMHNARYVRQKRELFCGPAAFLHVFAMVTPQKYKRMARDLFCTGKHTDPVSKKSVDATSTTFSEFFGSTRITSYEYRTSSSPDCDDCLDATDWIMASSLVQDVNKFSPPTPTGKKLAQLTLPGDMKQWIANFIPQAKTTQYGSYGRFLLGKISPLSSHVPAPEWDEVVDRIIEAKGQAVALALVTTKRGGQPNHWVALVDVIPGNGKYKGEDDCWIKTWGKYQKEPCEFMKYATYTVFLVDFTDAESPIPEPSLVRLDKDLQDERTHGKPLYTKSWK